MRLELIRDTYSRDMGTFGILSVYHDIGSSVPGRTFNLGSEKLFECHTVERPWANNAPNISCIPEGEYTMRPRRYYRGGYDTWEICDVPGRSYIMFHSANVPSDLEGCIGVGARRCVLGGEWGVESSRATLADLIAHIGNTGSSADVSIRITHILAGVLVKDGKEEKGRWNHPQDPL